MANIHTPSKHVLVKPVLNTAITAAANDGAGVDCRGYTRAMAIFHTKPAGAGTTSNCKLQQSSDNGVGDAFADVATAAFAEVATADGETLQVMNIDLSKRERYLRFVHTGAGAAAAGQETVSLLLFNAWNAPPTQDETAISV